MIKWSAWIKYYFHIDCEEKDENGNLKIDDKRFMELVGQVQYCVKQLNIMQG